MSLEDCILYRKIDDNWFVIPYGFTWDDSISDKEFSRRGFLVPSVSDTPAIWVGSDIFTVLDSLNESIDSEHGICYAGDYESDAPPEVPREHRVLLMPDSQKNHGVHVSSEPISSKDGIAILDTGMVHSAASFAGPMVKDFTGSNDPIDRHGQGTHVSHVGSEVQAEELSGDFACPYCGENVPYSQGMCEATVGGINLPDQTQYPHVICPSCKKCSGCHLLEEVPSVSDFWDGSERTSFDKASTDWLERVRFLHAVMNAVPAKTLEQHESVTIGPHAPADFTATKRRSECNCMCHDPGSSMLHIAPCCHPDAAIDEMLKSREQKRIDRLDSEQKRHMLPLLAAFYIDAQVDPDSTLTELREILSRNVIGLTPELLGDRMLGTGYTFRAFGDDADPMMTMDRNLHRLNVRTENGVITEVKELG